MLPSAGFAFALSDLKSWSGRLFGIAEHESWTTGEVVVDESAEHPTIASRWRVRKSDGERDSSLLAVGCFKRTLKADTRLIYSVISVNSWADFVPDVEACRPSHCLGCGQTAYKTNGRLRLHGHGLRSRGIWGPAKAEAEPAMWDIWVRRYLCVDCGVCLTVLPAGLKRAYRYSLSAIAMALTLWALWRRPARRVRDLVSPQRLVGASEPARWRSLRRDDD